MLLSIGLRLQKNKNIYQFFFPFFSSGSKYKYAEIQSWIIGNTKKTGFSSK